ncbi:MAG TPA: hypothetical protein VFH80_04205 [Solirubrobacteraceae bacterium]|nr:hypothetical protein [Solirubrobacteraceae bacterium]
MQPRSTPWSPRRAADWPCTFAGALEAPQIEVDPAGYDVEAIGRSSGVLVIRRIKVVDRPTAARDRDPEVERVHGFHARFGPVARSA